MVELVLCTVTDVHCDMLELVRCHLVTVFGVESKYVTGSFERHGDDLVPTFSVTKSALPNLSKRRIQETIAGVLRIYSKEWYDRLQGVRERRVW